MQVFGKINHIFISVKKCCGRLPEGNLYEFQCWQPHIPNSGVRIAEFHPGGISWHLGDRGRERSSLERPRAGTVAQLTQKHCCKGFKASWSDIVHVLSRSFLDGARTVLIILHCWRSDHFFLINQPVIPHKSILLSQRLHWLFLLHSLRQPMVRENTMVSWSCFNSSLTNGLVNN